VTLDKNINTFLEFDTETNAEKQWQKKGMSTTFKNSLSTKSYLNPQAGFEHLNVNKKVSEKQIVFLKNGNKFNNSKTHNENADDEYEKIDKMHIDTVTLDKNSNTYICNYTVTNNLDKKLNESQQINEEVSGILHPCLACSNGNFPTGAHRCVQCAKPVHSFGCSVKNIDSDEGYGETRICLTCEEYNKETNAEEQWQKKGKSTTFKNRRSKKSYLNPQAGFENLDLNKNGSGKQIVFFKNGNTFNDKPQTIKNIGKVILRNTCSVDSILTSLAYAAADSSNYLSFLVKHEKSDKTAKFITRMLSTKNVKKTSLYKERIELLALHYPYNGKEHTLVGNIQLIDVMGPLKSTATKLFNELPSYTKVNACKNMLCPNYMTVQKYPVLTLSAFDGYINVQEEIEKYFSTEEIDCIECPSRRKHTFNAKSHLLIEVMSLPKGKINYLHTLQLLYIT